MEKKEQLTRSQQRAYNTIMAGFNVFLTGHAGTGKSYLTRKVIDDLQYPLKLAWAVTVHKSQGQTFSAVNLNPNCWDSGQLYVALSRVQTIEGLHFTRPIYDRYLRLDPAVADFYERAALDEPEDAGVARDMKYESPKPKKETKKESVDFSDKDRAPSMDSEQLSLF